MKTNYYIDYLNKDLYNLTLNNLKKRNEEIFEKILKQSNYDFLYKEIRIIIYHEQAPYYYIEIGKTIEESMWMEAIKKYTKESIKDKTTNLFKKDRKRDYFKEIKEKEEEKLKKIQKQYKEIYLCDKKDFLNYINSRTDLYVEHTESMLDNRIKKYNIEKIKNEGNNTLEVMIPERYIFQPEPTQDWHYSYRLEDLFNIMDKKRDITYEEFIKEIKESGYSAQEEELTNEEFINEIEEIANEIEKKKTTHKPHPQRLR